MNFGHGARIIAHKDEIIDASYLIEEAVRAAEIKYPKGTVEQHFDYLNNQIKNSIPWDYAPYNKYFSYTKASNLDAEIKEIRKALANINDDVPKESKRLIANEIGNQFPALKEMAWRLELEKRQEAFDGNCMLDADPITVRLMAAIEYGQQKDCENYIEENGFSDATSKTYVKKFYLKEALSLSKQKQKNLARKLAQRMINQSNRSSSKAGLAIELEGPKNKSENIKGVRILINSGTIYSNASMFSGEKVSTINEKLISINGSFPATMLNARKGEPLENTISHFLIKGLNLKFIHWTELKYKGNPVLIIKHDAIKTEKMTGLFVLGPEVE